MKNLYDEKNGMFEVYSGSQIAHTIDEAIGLARAQQRVVSFEFNGVVVTVDATSDRQLIYRDWSRALSGYILKFVGPHPAERLSSADLARDAEVEAENERRREESARAYREQADAKRRDTEAKMSTAPAMAFSDEAAWRLFVEKNQDPYGGAVVTYAERWARLMQQAMDAGQPLERVAGVLSREADLEGITGFMYGCAVSALAQTWIHGEQLRRWHNLTTQIGTEGEAANESGGVLNPALLSIGR